MEEVEFRQILLQAPRELAQDLAGCWSLRFLCKASLLGLGLKSFGFWGFGV